MYTDTFSCNNCTIGVLFRGANDDDEVSGPSPVGPRPSGARDRAERDRDQRDGVDRHAKYYDDPREAKSSNQRRSARYLEGFNK